MKLCCNKKFNIIVPDKKADLEEELRRAKNEIKDRARKVKQAITALDYFTPDTADYNYQKERIEKARYALICAIGVYDGLRDEMFTTYHKHEIESHEFLESIMEG